MITCPWCGTSYATFQSNCKNCGGPLPAHQPVPGEAALFPPPAAPRPISKNYVWKLMFTDSWSVAGFVFLLLGVIFGMVGFGLTLGVVTAFVGIPFLGFGIAFLAAGVGVVGWRRKEKERIVNVLTWGNAARGQITGLEENYTVEINNRHPWRIDYTFDVIGQTFSGSVSTLKLPGPSLQPGQPVFVLYLPDDPTCNALYPHP